MSDIVTEYDKAASRAETAAVAIRRHTTRAGILSERKVTADRLTDIKALADRLEAIVRDFGLDEK